MNRLALAVSHALLMCVALGATGCGVGSIAPLLAEGDVRFDAKLIGSWRDSSSGASAVIAAASPDRYSIEYRDTDGKTGQFWAALGPMGSLRVLDIEPKHLPEDASAIYKSLLLPLHGAVFIESIEPELRYRSLNADSLWQYLLAHPTAIAHLSRADDVIITAPTADVQRFLEHYARRPGALGELNVWVRRTP